MRGLIGHKTDLTLLHPRTCAGIVRSATANVAIIPAGFAPRTRIIIHPIPANQLDPTSRSSMRGLPVLHGFHRLLDILFGIAFGISEQDLAIWRDHTGFAICDNLAVVLQLTFVFTGNPGGRIGGNQSRPLRSITRVWPAAPAPEPVIQDAVSERPVMVIRRS